MIYMGLNPRLVPTFDERGYIDSVQHMLDMEVDGHTFEVYVEHDHDFKDDTAASIVQHHDSLNSVEAFVIIAMLTAHRHGWVGAVS